MMQSTKNSANDNQMQLYLKEGLFTSLKTATKDKAYNATIMGRL